MGYPIRSLSDLLKNEREIRNLRANFYTFILYKEEHIKFRKFVLQNFNRLHVESSRSDAILFILDFPEEWMERKDIGYYYEINGREYQPALSNEEVNIVCKHFKVHPDTLPAVVIFQDFDSQGCINVSLSEDMDHKELLLFFQHLYSKNNGLLGWGRDYPSGPNLERGRLIGRERGLESRSHLYIKDRKATQYYSFVQTQNTRFNKGENIRIILEKMYMKMEKMELQLDRIETKVDRVLEVMESLQLDIESIKKTKRDEEQKLKIIYAKIDFKLSGLKEELKEDISIYEELLKDYVEHWDLLDDLSKEMLPLADYLFDKLIDLKNADYSPVILQYCRSLENELLKKLFVQFNLYLLNKYPNLEDFLQSDLEHEKTSHFAKSIKKNIQKNKNDIKYTLGEMGRILELTAGKNTIKVSPLLQEFKLFIKENFDDHFILSKEFLKRVKIVTEEFRNKCAHPYKIIEEEAKQCKETVPYDINGFLNNFTNGSIVDEERKVKYE